MQRSLNKEKNDKRKASIRRWEIQDVACIKTRSNFVARFYLFHSPIARTQTLLKLQHTIHLLGQGIPRLMPTKQSPGPAHGHRKGERRFASQDYRTGRENREDLQKREEAVAWISQ